MEFEKIVYYRQKRPPSLAQYLHRRKVAQVMSDIADRRGTVLDPETQRSIPRTAHLAKELLRGLTSDRIAEIHPLWVEDYRRDHETPEI